ncbi:MAG TPA: prolyl oligopeptidase family serine peptidase [Solirubrobacteraceae bacterium]
MSSQPSETHFIVLPGGGYAAHAENEAEPIVDWMSELRIPAAVLRYPLQSRHPIPLNAVRAEVRRLRAAGVVRVGVIGFSAGGHLGGQAALSDASSPDTRIDLAVLGYAITSMETETYRPARLILLGEDATPEMRRATSLDAIVTASAPPFFIWHTAEDPYVPVEHSYRLAAALAAHGVAHALHVFSQGPHSLGLARGAGEASVWTELAADWLTTRIGVLK